MEGTRRRSDLTQRRSRTTLGGLRLTPLGVDKIAALSRARVSTRETKPNGGGTGAEILSWRTRAEGSRAQ